MHVKQNSEAKLFISPVWQSCLTTPNAISKLIVGGEISCNLKTRQRFACVEESGKITREIFKAKQCNDKQTKNKTKNYVLTI